MKTKIKLDILSREIVKPSFSEINHPETHILSFFDQIPPSIYMSLVYFYPNAEEGKIDFHRSDALKKSLSAALSLYYPLAGRRNSDNLTIDCNNEGVLFLEARIGCNLFQVLNDSALREDTINLLFPDDLYYKDSNLGGPLLVQVTYFDCGGMAIAICICHGMMDMSSVCCFLNNWASLARKSGNTEVMARPEFNFGTLYPRVHLPPVSAPSGHFKQVKCVQRSFVLDNSKIAKLKAMVQKEEVKNPTRVEVVVALVFKCAVSAAVRARSGLLNPATMHLAVNLRSRVCPPVSESAIGNFIGSISVSVSREEISKLEWVDLVGKIRNNKYNYFSGCAENSGGEALSDFVLEHAKWMTESAGDDQDVYINGNWCGFPLYEADFGWGKPTWVTPARMVVKNSIHMMDTSAGGIEVLVSLEEQQMAIFASDEELLAFATVES